MCGMIGDEEDVKERDGVEIVGETLDWGGIIKSEEYGNDCIIVIGETVTSLLRPLIPTRLKMTEGNLYLGVALAERDGDLMGKSVSFATLVKLACGMVMVIADNGGWAGRLFGREGLVRVWIVRRCWGDLRMVEFFFFCFTAFFLIKWFGFALMADLIWDLFIAGGC